MLIHTAKNESCSFLQYLFLYMLLQLFFVAVVAVATDSPIHIFRRKSSLTNPPTEIIAFVSSAQFCSFKLNDIWHLNFGLEEGASIVVFWHELRSFDFSFPWKFKSN